MLILRCLKKIINSGGGGVIKVNKQLLRSKMALFGDTVATLSSKIGTSTASLSLKINGKSDFRQSEIDKIKNIYYLSAEEIVNIFFASSVSYKDTKGDDK